MDKEQATHTQLNQQERVIQSLTKMEARLEAKEEAIKNLQKEIKEIKAMKTDT